MTYALRHQILFRLSEISYEPFRVFQASFSVTNDHDKGLELKYSPLSRPSRHYSPVLKRTFLAVDVPPAIF